MVNTSNSHFGQRKKNIIPEIGPINHKIGVKINKKIGKKNQYFFGHRFSKIPNARNGKKHTPNER